MATAHGRGENLNFEYSIHIIKSKQNETINFLNHNLRFRPVHRGYVSSLSRQDGSRFRYDRHACNPNAYP